MPATRLHWMWMLMALLSGCGAPPLPPGGQGAVEFWHRVLLEHPDLPAKVRAIVEDRGIQPVTLDHLPSSEVRIHTDDGEISISGSRIDLIVTDLGADALKQLLAVWEAVPAQAARLGLGATSYNTSSPRRKIVVLGSEGRVDVCSVGESYSQSIRILDDEAAAETRIGIHAFGPLGQAALDELKRNYHAVRGPPKDDVHSGYVSLPPPDDSIAVLVIGRLRELNIEGAYGHATQDISVSAYFNDHQTSDYSTGMQVGSPFADRLARVAETSSQEVYSPPAAAEAVAAPTASYPSAPVAPYTPGTVSAPQIQPPHVTPWTPPTQTFNPPVFVPPPVFTPPPVYRPPVRFR